MEFVLKVIGEELFITRSVNQLVWGYEDKALQLAKNIAPEWFYKTFIGYFMDVSTYVILFLNLECHIFDGHMMSYVYISQLLFYPRAPMVVIVCELILQLQSNLSIGTIEGSSEKRSHKTGGR